MSEETKKALQQIIRKVIEGADTAPHQGQPENAKVSSEEQRKMRVQKNGRKRERALEIARCFEMICPTTATFMGSELSRNSDLEPLAAAIRQGRLDLLEMALSARQCSTPPETADLRTMNGDGDAAMKEEARARRTAFEKAFRETLERKREAAEWAAYLLVNGYCEIVEESKADDGGDTFTYDEWRWAKKDVVDFLGIAFPDVSKAIPPQDSKKREHAEFWASVGVDIEPAKGAGTPPSSVRQAMKNAKESVTKKLAPGSRAEG